MMLFTTTILLIATTLSTLALGIYSSTLVGNGCHIGISTKLWREFVPTRTKTAQQTKRTKSKSKHHHCTVPTIIRQLEKNNADSNERSATISRHHGGRRRRRQRRIIISQCQQKQRGMDLLLQHAMAIDAKALWEYKVQQGE